MKKYSGILVLLLLLVLPLVSHACPFCQGGGAGAKKVVYAYKSITAFLALIPIGGMTGILYWLKIKTRRPSDQVSENNLS